MKRNVLILATITLAGTLACAAQAERGALRGALPDPKQDALPEPVRDVAQGYRWVPVTGTGVHYFTTAIVHDVQPTATGFIQRSTDIVELEGDLKGRVLYHPVSVFDFAAGTLVNTGHQVFSGTVLGSEPVMIHDDQFRFDVNLFTGETTGKIYFSDPIAGPKTQCTLDVVGTGSTPEGDGMVTYSGYCKTRVPPRAR